MNFVDGIGLTVYCPFLFVPPQPFYSHISTTIHKQGCMHALRLRKDVYARGCMRACLCGRYMYDKKRRQEKITPCSNVHTTNTVINDHSS